MFKIEEVRDLAREAVAELDPACLDGRDAARPAVRVRVDLPSLLRGRTEAGEICEIPGVGPVGVSHAREVLSHGLLQLVITDGVDVQTVVSNTRHVPTASKIAIAERDRTCKIRGCDCNQMLERHHTLDFEKSHRPTYKELGNLSTRSSATSAPSTTTSSPTRATPPPTTTTAPGTSTPPRTPKPTPHPTRRRPDAPACG
ncbi:MAG: hypothetical protein MUP97_14345, partial [Acidimicrobiia bacterium]|nr:hypothetical protein [Acidimicrobiia bacterium]